MTTPQVERTGNCDVKSARHRSPETTASENHCQKLSAEARVEFSDGSGPAHGRTSNLEAVRPCTVFCALWTLWTGRR